MILKFMPKEIAEKLLEGHKDILTPAVTEREKFYSSQSCPRCGGSCRKQGDSRTMFTDGDMLAKFYLECLACGEVFNPHNGMTIKMGNVGKALEPAIPILKTRD